jgi:DNA invertase Pin-like site-specific DNA recombinase
MLTRTFDAKQTHRYVRYARMSTEMQNPRSPDQQFDEIDRTLRRLGHDWTHVADYRDDATSGRLIKKRPSFSRMLSDLRTKRVDADVILVDTFERFGRSDDIGLIRKKLADRNRIYVLIADSQFADPTTEAGQAVSVIQTLRSTQEGRTKAHNVLRGKRDLASRGRWPGGPMPFGFKLESVIREVRGVATVDGHILVPDPVAAPVVAKLFRLALDTGWGTRRLANALNSDFEVPEAVKPISAERVRQVIESTLCVGTLTFNKHQTGIVDDVTIRERVDPAEHLIVPNFCQPLVEPALAEAVWEQRRQAKEARTKARPMRRVEVESEDGSDDTRVIIAKNHILSGLVRCSECGASMRVTSSTYSKDGISQTYAYYECWRLASGQCSNRFRPREDILREAVIAKLRFRLFPPEETAEIIPAWLEELAEKVRGAYRVRQQSTVDPKIGMQAELNELSRSMQGWAQSLANPDLSAPLRSNLQQQWATAHTRHSELADRLRNLETSAERFEDALDLSSVLDRLRRLDDLLAGRNVVESNRQLGWLIDAVVCYPDGRVQLRTHQLGLFRGVEEWCWGWAATPAIRGGGGGCWWGWGLPPTRLRSRSESLPTGPIRSSSAAPGGGTNPAGPWFTPKRSATRRRK